MVLRDFIKVKDIDMIIKVFDTCNLLHYPLLSLSLVDRVQESVYDPSPPVMIAFDVEDSITGRDDTSSYHSVNSSLHSLNAIRPQDNHTELEVRMVACSIYKNAIL